MMATTNTVIPGCADGAGPEIHNHDDEYGFFDVQLHIKARAARAYDAQSRIGE